MQSNILKKNNNPSAVHMVNQLCNPFDILKDLDWFVVVNTTLASSRPETSSPSLQSEGPHKVRVCQESNRDLTIHNPDCYLYVIDISSKSNL